MADNRIYEREVRRVTLRDPYRLSNPVPCISEEEILKEDTYFHAGSCFKDKSVKLKRSDKSVIYQRNISIEPNVNKKEFTCELCGIVCTGIDNFKLHIEGKKHVKKLKEQRILQKMEPISRNVQIQTTRNCDMPQKKFLKPDAYLQHGKSESTQEISSLYGLMKTLKLDDPSQFPEGASCSKSTCIHCDVCKKWFKSPMAYDCHIETCEHYRKGQNLKELVLMRDVLRTSEGGQILECEICGKTFSGPVPYKQHLMSDAHSKKDDIVKEAIRMNIIRSSELHCRDCAKKFSGIVPFNDHLRGSSHKRLAKKKIMLKNLEEEHPKILSYSMFGIGGEDVKSEGDVRLDCKACNLEFEKPEDVQEHYTGAKHREVVKGKLQVNKLHEVIKKQDLLMEESHGRLSDSNDDSDELLIEL